MAFETLKVLGQARPGSSVLADLYTVLTGQQAICSSLIICNQSSSTTANVRVSVAVNGAADTSKQYIYYDLPIAPNTTYMATIGITLANGDIVRVRSDSGTVSFNLSGSVLS